MSCFWRTRDILVSSFAVRCRFIRRLGMGCHLETSTDWRLIVPSWISVGDWWLWGVWPFSKWPKCSRKWRFHSLKLVVCCFAFLYIVNLMSWSVGRTRKAIWWRHLWVLGMDVHMNNQSTYTDLCFPSFIYTLVHLGANIFMLHIHQTLSSWITFIQPYITKCIWCHVVILDVEILSGHSG